MPMQTALGILPPMSYNCDELAGKNLSVHCLAYGQLAHSTGWGSGPFKAGGLQEAANESLSSRRYLVYGKLAHRRPARSTTWSAPGAHQDESIGPELPGSPR